jgi:hypothetical protein
VRVESHRRIGLLTRATRLFHRRSRFALAPDHPLNLAQSEEKERAQLTQDLATLKQGAARVELTVEPGGAMILDERIPVRGERVSNRYGPVDGITTLLVRAGNHVITVQREGYEPQRWEFEAKPGEPQTKRIVLQKPSKAPPAAKQVRKHRPIPVGVWAGIGVTGALVAAGIGVGAAALANKSQYNSANDGTQADKASSLRSKGQALNIATDVLLGATVVSAGITAAFLFTRPEVPVEEKKARVLPSFTLSYAGLLATSDF